MFMSLITTFPVASSQATPQFWVVLGRTNLWLGFTGFSPAGTTKKAISRGAVGSLTSITRTPSEYQEA